MLMASESQPLRVAKSMTSLGLGIVGLLGHNVVLDASEHTEFGLNGHIKLVGIFHNLLGQSNVLFIGE